MADTASVRRFCNMTDVADLAQRVKTLILTVTNDLHSQKQSLFDDEDGLIDALYACSDIVELQFINESNDQAAQLRQEETDGDTVEVPAPDSVFDISSSFSYILSFAEQAGVCPIGMVTLGSPLCGLSDCSALAERGETL